MSKTTTASVRLSTEKKEKLSKVLESLNSSRQEALEEAIDHLISKYEILALIPPEKLEEKINSLFRELADADCIETEVEVDRVPLHHKAVLLSTILNLSQEAHEHRLKKIQRHLSDKYEKVPKTSSLSLNPFEIQDLKEKSLTEDVEINPKEFYRNGDQLILPLKIRYLVEAVDMLLGEKKKQRFMDITKEMHGDRTPVFIADREIQIDPQQNQKHNTMSVEVKLPFRRSED